ncbi:MAG: hypothetical protein JW779_06560 [Candidatus Thorarchaeota archaeon]|nr:hypothetical protein [Candidatus Thorarchaeota archaeon]
MMNKFQNLMESATPVEVIIDTGDDDSHYNSIRGIITNVGRDYIELLRAAYQDEKSRYGVGEVRVVIPIIRIAEINYYHNEHEKPKKE